MAKVTLSDITTSYNSTSKINANQDLIEVAFENTLSRDGTSPNSMQSDLDLNGYLIINVNEPVNPTDASTKSYVDSRTGGASLTTVPYVSTVGGTANNITLTPDIALTAYSEGIAYRFKVGTTNTGAVTVDISGLGTKAITKDGGTALVSGDLVSGKVYTITYDGTQFQVGALPEAGKSVGTESTRLGEGAGSSITTGASNIAIGQDALATVTDASDNIAIGRDALTANTTGARNIAIGTQSSDANTSGVDNVSVGYVGHSAGTSGNRNTIVGNYAGDGLTTGSNNVAIGMEALSTDDTGSGSIAIGYQALLANFRSGTNIGIGQLAATANSSGTGIVAIGSSALLANTSGTNNIAIGESLKKNTTGTNNTAIGYLALEDNVSNSNSTAVGFNSLLNSTGTQNTAIGSVSGNTITTGANNTCVGYNAQASSATVSNEVTIGNTSVTTTRVQVDWTILSDGRDKENIEPLYSGLDFVSELKPRTFTWNHRDGNKKTDKPEPGFISQEVMEAQDKLGVDLDLVFYAESTDTYELKPTKLIPVLVKAVQELSAEIDILEKKLEKCLAQKN